MQIINHEGIPTSGKRQLKLIKGQSMASRSEDFRLGWAWAREQIALYGPSGTETVQETCGGEGGDEFDLGAMSYLNKSILEEV